MTGGTGGGGGAEGCFLLLFCNSGGRPAHGIMGRPIEADAAVDEVAGVLLDAAAAIDGPGRRGTCIAAEASATPMAPPCEGATSAGRTPSGGFGGCVSAVTSAVVGGSVGLNVGGEMPGR
jgi:hypothetical protein